jgi:glutamine synthetase
VVLGWDMMDNCYDNTTVTGWQHGFPDALARLDLDTARHVPWDNNVPFFLGEFVNADGSRTRCARARRSSACSSAPRSWASRP